MDYDEIAYELDSELTGKIERCSYGGDCILWSDPSKHPNIRYNPNNVVPIFLDILPSKDSIKNELLEWPQINLI